MENSTLEKYISAWKKEKDFQDPVLTEEDILRYLTHRSKNILQQFKQVLWTDIAIKAVLLPAGGTICLMFPFLSKAFSMGVFLILLTLAGIGIQWENLRQLSMVNPAKENLLNLLKNYVAFYKDKYIKTIFISAATGPLIFVNGALFYYNYRYHRIPPLAAADVVVLGIFLFISYTLGLAVQFNHHKYQIEEYENCITELENNSITQTDIRQYKCRKRKIIIFSVIALLSGTALLLYLFLR